MQNVLSQLLHIISCPLSLQVPEIISTLRQVGKNSARNDDLTSLSNKTSTYSGGNDPPEKSLSFSTLSTATTSKGSTSAISPSAFAKKFEVLFCGRVSVAHKKAPPALIDECIEKFGRLHGTGASNKGGPGGGSVDGVRRAVVLQSNGVGAGVNGNGAAGSPTSGKRPILFKRDPSFLSLQALDENGLSPEMSITSTTDAQNQCGVQPTSLQENRTMLFTVN